MLKAVAQALRPRQLLQRRWLAFRDVFFTDGAVSPSARIVLSHLRDICFATRSTAAAGDVNAMLICEGRRQVWLEIEKYLRLDPDQIYSLVDQVEEPDDD